MSLCREAGADAALSEAWSRGAKGAEELAEKVLKLADAPVPELKFAYDAEMKLYSKLDAVARGVYGADGVDFTPAARRDIDRLEQQGFGALPVCIAKTQYSFSDDPKLLGRPRGFRITVRAAHVSAGAGFVVALTGNIMTMPGLPKKPAAEGIDVLPDGRITGIF
jgi:formate--tetrahydrofolate ligase